MLHLCVQVLARARVRVCVCVCVSVCLSVCLCVSFYLFFPFICFLSQVSFVTNLFLQEAGLAAGLAHCQGASSALVGAATAADA